MNSYKEKDNGSIFGALMIDAILTVAVLYAFNLPALERWSPLQVPILIILVVVTIFALLN